MNENKNFKVDFIGIGTAKSGTTWIANMLEKHPDICISEPKEVNYFNRESNSSAKIRYGNKSGPFLNKDYDKPIEFYQRHFNHCKKDSIVGEFSPVYSYDPQARFMIKEKFPNAKLIIVFRNPIDRAYSEYWMFRNSFKIESRPFEEVIHDKNSMHIEKGMYYKQLKNYLDLFERKQIHVIFFDDIKKDPAKVLHKLYGFLGVDTSFVPHQASRGSNYSKTSRIKGAIEFMNGTVKFLVKARMLFLVRILRKLKINKLLLKVIAKKTAYSPMDEKTREYLRGVFSDDMGKLEKELGVDLSHWR